MKILTVKTVQISYPDQLSELAVDYENNPYRQIKFSEWFGKIQKEDFVSIGFHRSEYEHLWVVTIVYLKEYEKT